MKENRVNVYSAYNTDTQKWVQETGEGTPDKWFDNPDIDRTSIKIINFYERPEYEWRQINSYLRYDVGWSTTKINELRKAYPTFKDYLFARDESALVDLLNHAEANFPDFGTQEADHIRDLLGIN